MAEATAAALGAPIQRLYFAADGATFAEITAPVAGEAVSAQLWGPIGGWHYLLQASKDGASVRLFRTTDGSTWEELPAPPVWVMTLTELAGRLVAVGSTVDGRSFESAVLGDDATWHTTDLTGVVGDITRDTVIGPLASGDAGIAVLVQRGVTDIGPATSVEQPAQPAPAAVDDVVVPATEAPVIVTEPGAWDVVHTLDGTTWSREPLADLLAVDPAEIGDVQRVAGAGTTMTIAVTLRQPDPSVPAEQLVLVGTPKG